MLVREGRVGHNGLVLDAGKNDAGTTSRISIVAVACLLLEVADKWHGQRL